MRQQRDRHVDELREEVQLQVSLLVERELTTVLRFLDVLREEMDLETAPPGLDRHEEELNPERMLDSLEERLEDFDASASGERQEGEREE